MKIIMVDLETLSTAPNAAILSIGAVCFDDDGPAASVDDAFLISVNRDYYDMQTTFNVDPKTVAWWATQGRAAQDSLKINRVETLPLAMDAFTTWVEKQGEVDLIMAKPAHFDIPILANAARHSYGANDALPWKHWQVRCMRTICGLYPQVAKEARATVYPQFVRHRADHDAVRQAIDLQYIIAERYSI